MLSQEDTELLTRIGPGTAMGELIRHLLGPSPASGLEESPDQEDEQGHDGDRGHHTQDQ